MKNVSSIKSNKVDSPKTPGGISKSLLTPCRRVGLSRNWKKAGPSPFVSPLTSSNSPTPEVKVEKKVPRKRKEREVEEENETEIEESNLTPVDTNASLEIDKTDVTTLAVIKSDEIIGTPSRHVALPRKKKSKLLSALNTNVSEIHNKLNPGHDVNIDNKKDIQDIEIVSLHPDTRVEKKVIENKEDTDFKVTEVVTPVRTVSKSKLTKNKKLTELKVQKEVSSDINKKLIVNVTNINIDTPTQKDIEPKSRSPNELTKECIVVIQKKIFTTDKKDKDKNKDKIDTEILDEKKPQTLGNSKINNFTKIDEQNKISILPQTKFDSDSEDEPLSHLHNKQSIEKKNKLEIHATDDDDDDEFMQENKVKVSKLKDKTTSISGLKTKPKTTKDKVVKSSKINVPILMPSSQSSNSIDEDHDDFEFQTKKTILIRKSYDKVTKPLKAKSTGSITQRDIDELRSKIEVKKKLLLAKAACNDTEDLRELIKKWQRGCQDALMELMELMKHKFQDKQNMDYSEMLKSLKIPSNLVGYDEENDCFITPDDANIVLSKFNKL